MSIMIIVTIIIKKIKKMLSPKKLKSMFQNSINVDEDLSHSFEIQKVCTPQK